MEPIFFLRFLNRDCAKNYRYVRFSHYAHVILHIEKPRKKHHEQGQQFKKKDPTGFFQGESLETFHSVQQSHSVPINVYLVVIGSVKAIGSVTVKLFLG